MKYYNYELIKFLKHDAKKIKYFTNNFKNSEILNILSQFFGWRHFNELSKNNKNLNYNNKISYLHFDNMAYSEIEEWKNNYKQYLEEKFFLSKNNINKLNSLILRFKTRKKIYIDNNKLEDFEINLEDYYIKLTNKEVKYLFLTKLKIENDVWSKLTLNLANTMKKLIKDLEGDNINYQEKIRYFMSLENLFNYIKNNTVKSSEFAEKYPAVYSLPFIENVLKKDTYLEALESFPSFFEHYGYLTMGIAINSFTEKNIENKIEIKLKDLKNKINNNKDKNIIIYNAKNCNNALMNSFLKKQLLAIPNKYNRKIKKEKLNKVMDNYKKKYDKNEIWTKMFNSLIELLPTNLFFSALEGDEKSIKILSDLDYIYENALRSDNKKLINRLEFIHGFDKNINNQNKTAKEQYDIQIRPFLEYIKENNI